MSRGKEAASMAVSSVQTVTGTSNGELTLITDVPVKVTRSRLGVEKKIRPVLSADRDYARLEPQVRARPAWLKKYTAWVVVADLLAALLASTVAIKAFQTEVPLANPHGLC